MLVGRKYRSCKRLFQVNRFGVIAKWPKAQGPRQKEKFFHRLMPTNKYLQPISKKGFWFKIEVEANVQPQTYSSISSEEFGAKDFFEIGCSVTESYKRYYDLE